MPRVRVPRIPVPQRVRALFGGRAAAAFVALLLLAVGALLIPWGESTQYGAYGEGYSHLSRFREEVQLSGAPVSVIVTSPLLLDDVARAEGHLYVANGIEREYTGAEVDALVAFTERGGRLLVLDDFQNANPLAVRFGVQYDRTPLLDSTFNRSVSFVRAEGVVDGKPVGGLLFNGPTTLSVTAPDARILARSSNESYADVNGDRTVNQGDRHGPFDLAVAVGNPPRAVFVADASLLTNDLLEQENALYKNRNREFGLALIDLLAPEGVRAVYFDESRHVNGLAEPSYRALALTVGASRTPAGMALLAVAAVGGGALLVWTGLQQSERRHVQRLDGRRPRSIPIDGQRDRLRAILLSKLDGQLNVPDVAAFVRDNRAEAERLLGDAQLAAFVAAPADSYREGEWARILEAAERYLQ